MESSIGGSSSSTKPVRFYNHAGLENGGNTYGACGAKWQDERRFTTSSEWLTPSGDTVPFRAQATYTEGQEIVIRSFIRANHRGHIEMYACPNIDAPTDDCFRKNPLEFVEDLLHGAPKYPAYPLWAMLAPPGGKFVQSLNTAPC